jgi:hypothetical protein
VMVAAGVCASETAGKLTAQEALITATAARRLNGRW